MFVATVHFFWIFRKILQLFTGLMEGNFRSSLYDSFDFHRSYIAVESIRFTTYLKVLMLIFACTEVELLTELLLMC